MQEWDHVVYVLTQVKNIYRSGDMTVPRIPTYIALLLAHSFRAIFYPSLFIYPITAKFLLQRPEVDVADVPLLFGMLYSSEASNNAWKKERTWIVRFLADGMKSTASWKVMKRRHTWDLLASLYQSSLSDIALGDGIIEVLANISCNEQAATSITLRSGILSWIEMQLIQRAPNVTSQARRSIAWVKILENLMLTVDIPKIEQATNGNWRRSIARSLLLLIEERDFGMFPVIRTFYYSISSLASRYMWY